VGQKRGKGTYGVLVKRDTGERHRDAREVKRREYPLPRNMGVEEKGERERDRVFRSKCGITLKERGRRLGEIDTEGNKSQ